MAAIIGPRASTVRTEGGAIGGLAGRQLVVRSQLGARFQRPLHAVVPPARSRATTVFLDRASLTGEQRAFNFGISCSYRIAL